MTLRAKEIEMLLESGGKEDRANAENLLKECGFHDPEPVRFLDALPECCVLILSLFK